MRRHAVTLLEMVLVLALVVILAALAYPAIDAMFAQRRLSAGADAVKAALALARSQAIEDGRPYRFAYVPGRGNYRVAPDSGSFWSGGGEDAVASESAPPLQLSSSLPTGVAFVEPGGAGPAEGDATELAPEEVATDQWQAVVVFLPDGTARDATDALRSEVEVTIQGAVGRPAVVSLRCLTGTVRSRRPATEGGP